MKKNKSCKKICFIKLYKIFILCTMGLLLSSGLANAWWKPRDYARYDYKSFEQYKKARQLLSFEHIDYPLLHAAVFYETNRQRDIHDLPRFRHSEALEEAAREHSKDMVVQNFFSHRSKVPGKRTLSQRLALVGLENVTMAENIATVFAIDYRAGQPVFVPPQNGGYFSYQYRGEPIKNRTYLNVAANVVDQWMHSPGHRRNILNPQYRCLGVGAAFYRDADFHGMPSFKVTQNFADRDKSMLKKSNEN